MRKIFGSVFLCSTLVASNYRLMPLSSDGLALSGANLAKSFSSDAAYLSPANMVWLGDRAKFDFSLVAYQINGATFYKTDNEVADGYYYPNSDKQYGDDFLFALPDLSFVYPVANKHAFGFAAYTDMSAVYGWQDGYAKAFANKFDMRGGSLAFSYAYKLSDELSFGAAITYTHTKLAYSLAKNNVGDPSYPDIQSNPDNFESELEYLYYQNLYSKAKGNGNGYWIDEDGEKRHLVWVYDGKARLDNFIQPSYRFSFTYIPEFFDQKVRFSLMYNSSFKNEFSGKLNFNISKYGLEHIADANLTQESPVMSPEDEQLNQLMNIIIQALELDFQDENINHLDTPVVYNDLVKVHFLYPASLNFGAAIELGKHEFLLNIGQTYWHKTKGLDFKVSGNGYDDFIEDIIFNYEDLIEETCAKAEKLGYCLNEKGEIDNDKVTQASKLILSSNPEIREELEKFFVYNIIDNASRLKQPKWKDTIFFSLGYRYNYNDRLAFMLGFATEKSPINRKDISFLAKDSRLYQYSSGLEYVFNKNMTFNFSFAYQYFQDTSVREEENELIVTSGKFKNQSNVLANFGLSYTF